jgi:hypothetical protein
MVLLKAAGGAVPLLRGVEGCVNEHAGEHTPATTHSNAPPLKRGVLIRQSLNTIKEINYEFYSKRRLPHIF